MSAGIIVKSLLSADLLQQTLIAEPHGIVQEDYGIQCGSKYQLFPESINRVPLVKADLSIPPLNKAVSEEV